VQADDRFGQIRQALLVRDVRAAVGQLPTPGLEAPAQRDHLDVDDVVYLVQLLPQSRHQRRHVALSHRILQLLVSQVMVREERVLLAQSRQLLPEGHHSRRGGPSLLAR